MAARVVSLAVSVALVTETGVTAEPVASGIVTCSSKYTLAKFFLIICLDHFLNKRHFGLFQ